MTLDRPLLLPLGAFFLTWVCTREAQSLAVKTRAGHIYWLRLYLHHLMLLPSFIIFACLGMSGQLVNWIKLRICSRDSTIYSACGNFYLIQSDNRSVIGGSPDKLTIIFGIKRDSLRCVLGGISVRGYLIWLPVLLFNTIQVIKIHHFDCSLTDAVQTRQPYSIPLAPCPTLLID